MAALSELTRVRLLRLLERHELGVAELCDVLQLPQSSVSRHLKVLADGGWVLSRRQGTNHLYRLTLDELEEPARKLWVLAREQSDSWPGARHDAGRLQRVLGERQSDSQAFFAGAADQWDKLRDELYGASFPTEALLALLPGDAVVADLGCGTGGLMARVAPHVGQVIGIDDSTPMLKAARRRTGELKNVDIRRGDLSSLPIQARSCDAAVLLLALTYVADPLAALREAARILRPGGRVVIVDLLEHDRDDFRQQMGQRWNGFSIETLQAQLAQVGLVQARARSLPAEPRVKGPGLLLATGIRK